MAKKKKRKPAVKHRDNTGRIKVQVPPDAKFSIESGNALRMSPLPAALPPGITPAKINLTPDQLEAFQVDTAQKQDDEAKSLLREYNARLPEFGYGLTREAIMSLDRASIYEAQRYLYDDEIANRLYVEYSGTIDMFFAFVPCFTEGCVEFTEGGFIHWCIEDIDVEARMLSLNIAVYFDENGDWTPGVSGLITLQNVTTTGAYDLSITQGMAYSDIYHAIPLKNFNWSEKQKVIWKNTICGYARQIETAMVAAKTNAVVEAATQLTYAITTLNYYLDIYTPVLRKRAPDERRKSTRTTIEGEAPAATPTQRVRMFDIVPVTSMHRPHVPTKETVVKYRLAAWKARGHIRHYKSGKTAYIGETVRHRRVMKDADKTIAPAQLIYIKDNLKEEENT